MKQFKEKHINTYYYRLKFNKKLADGTEISTNETFRKISKKHKCLFQVETVDTPQIKKYFWVHEDEVDFIECKKELWTVEMLEKVYKEKNGIWI